MLISMFPLLCRLSTYRCASATSDFVDNEWLPKHAEDYFKERDAQALHYLSKVLG